MIYVFFIVVLVIVIYIISVRNKLVKLDNMADESFSTMDVYLKKRWDLVPNLVNSVKGYTQHESKLFEAVTLLRNNKYESLKQNEKIDTNVELEKDLQQIVAVAESYPTLKADTNFLELSRDLNKVEEDIANARKYYNAVIRMYNDKVEVFPCNIIANIFNFKPRKMFEAGSEERKNVQIDL